MTDIHYLSNKEAKKLFPFNVDSSKTFANNYLIDVRDAIWENGRGGDRKYDSR